MSSESGGDTAVKTGEGTPGEVDVNNTASNEFRTSSETTSDTNSPSVEKKPGFYSRMERDVKRLFWSLITTIGLPIVVIVVTHNPILMLIAFAIPCLAWGIRVVPSFHNSLLVILWVRRTSIGFSEGWVWVPWFLGARLREYNVQKRDLDISEEDNWTKDGMHLVYDIFLQYGITPLDDPGFFKNLFQFFICVFTGERNAKSLYKFSDIISMESAVKVIAADAGDLTIKAINRRGYKFILNQKLDDLVTEADDKKDPEENGQDEPDTTIQVEVIEILNKNLERSGLCVYIFDLKDLDFHSDTAAILQRKQLAKVKGEARKAFYSIVLEVAKNLTTAGDGVANTAIQVELAEALKMAAENGGPIGALIQAMTADKALPVTQLIDNNSTD